MKKIKQNKLLSSILTSDIIYFSGNTLKKNSFFFLNKIKIKNQSHYTILNIIVLIQTIKQIIRILQFNSKYSEHFLQIISSNNLNNKIIEYIFKKYNNNAYIYNTTKLNDKLKSKAVIYLDTFNTNLKFTIQKSFNNYINLIILITSYFNKNFFGNYKMLTDINNYKNLIFLSLIILLSQKKL